MGQNHARIYSELGNLVGVYDALPESAQKVAKRLGTIAYGSVEALLVDVDAVSVCTPTTNHFEVAREAIRRGRAALVEKPFTGEELEARALCELAEEKEVTLASGFVERFNPVVEATKKLLAAGKMGRLVSIGSRRVSSFPFRIRDVGVIKDLAIHDIDVIRYMTGQEVLSVSALGGRMNGLKYEDHANLLMRMSEGVNATIEVNWLTPMKVRTVAMTCSSGFALMDYTDQSLEFASAKAGELDITNLSQVPMELNTQHLFVKKEEPLKRELEAFIKAADANEKAVVDGWDALANIRVCNSALRSLADGQVMGVESIQERREETLDQEIESAGSIMLVRR